MNNNNYYWGCSAIYLVHFDGPEVLFALFYSLYSPHLHLSLMLIYNVYCQFFRDHSQKRIFSICCFWENWDAINSSQFRRKRQQFSPDISVINSVLTISSSCFSWLLMCGIVLIKYVGLCLYPVIKHKYVACGKYNVIFT